MASSGIILVTGATGNVGSAVIANLTAMGTEVRALVRNESKAHSLKDAGVKVVLGDMEKPETLDDALRGVDKVFLITPVSPNAVTQASNGIAAATRAGSLHIVRLSAVKAAPDSPTRVGRLHAETEAQLKASGLAYTILRPHFYMQNTIMAAQTVASDGIVYMPFKDSNLGMIDIRDIADVAAKVLTEDGHEGRTYTPTGPASISFYDVAAGLSRMLGREVKYVDVPLEAARQAMLGMGLSEWMANAYREYFKAYTEGWGDFTTDDVEQVTGKPARSFEKFAHHFAQAFGGAVRQAA